MLNYIAVVTMLVYHIGLVFYPDTLIFRIIGRLAMPIYIFLAVQAINHTSDFKKYCIRLLGIALIAQLPFMYVITPWKLNIVFNILLSVLVIKFIQKTKLHMKSIFMVGVALLISYYLMEYSFYCLMLMMGYYFIRNGYYLTTYHFVLNLIVMIAFNWVLQIFSLVATLFIFLEKKLPKIKINRNFYRAFYPGHLLFIGIIKWIFY